MEKALLRSLPQTDNTLLVRTDFTDPVRWRALQTAITTPDEDDFVPDVHIVDDPVYSGLTTEQVASLVPARGFLLIVADKTTFTAPEMPLLAVLPHEEEGDEAPLHHSELRVIAEDLGLIESCIRFGIMDWEEFVEAAGDDGVFRGF
jgi:hypothetical protein